MANTKVTQHVIANNAIQEAMITNAAVTPDKLHGTLDLSSKSITLPSAAVATTQSQSDGSTKIATTAYVDTAVSNLVDSSPSSLNTLNELAAALNDDASFSTTVTNSIATKLPLAGGTMTGNIAHASDFTIDVGGGISLDADDEGTISFKDGGTRYGIVKKASNNFEIQSMISDGDLVIKGNDGGSTITALTLDMSAAGFATFNDGGSFGGTGALKVPVGTTAQRPSAATGQIRWNSTDGALEVYNGSSWTGVGTTGSNKVLDTFTGDGSTTAFTLSVTPANEDALMVFIDGVYQEKGDYSLSNAVITLDTAPASGEKIAVHTTTASVHDGTSALTQQFTGDGSTTAFTLSQDPNGENNTQVFVNGVYQAKTTYSVSGTTLTFASAPANSAVIEVIMFTVTTLGNTDTVTEGVGNLYHTSARAVSAVSAGNLTGLTVDTNTLSVDATNNRVGIGTTSPAGDLHVVGATGSAGRIYVADADNGTTATDSLLLTKSGDTGFLYNRESSGNLQLGAGDDPSHVIIKSTGSVLIGNTSGSGILNVDNGATDGGYVHFANNVGSSTLTNDKGLAFGWNKSNGGGESIIIGNQGAGSTGGLRFATNTSGGSYAERMTIDANGKVGIGNTTPGNSHSTANMLVVGSGSAGGMALYNGANAGGYYFARDNANNTDAYDGGMSYDGSRNLKFHTNAGAARMTIDGSGNVGIGTSSTNSFKLFVDTSAKGLFVNAGDGGYTAVGFSGDGTSTEASFTTHNGLIYMGSENSGGTGSNGEFRIQPSVSERMRINANGQILGATDTAPNYPGTFTAARTGGSNTTTQNTWGFNATAGGSHKDFGYKASGTGSYAYGVLNAAETTWMSRLDFSGAAHLTNTTIQSISDRRLKKDIVDANSQWDDIKALQFKNFKWKDEAKGSGTYLGLIADEVESVSPGLVGTDAISAETMPEDGVDPEYKNVKYSIVWMKAVKALQEAMTKIETLEAKVAELEG